MPKHGVNDEFELVQDAHRCSPEVYKRDQSIQLDWLSAAKQWQAQADVSAMDTC